MKKYLVLLLLSCSLLGFSSNIGHFMKKVDAENITVENVSDHFGQWFNLAPETAFEVIGDKTDKMGVRHISYQQYYRGVKVEGCLVLVHARDNRVLGVNGVVMERHLSPRNTTANIDKRKAVRKVRGKEGNNAQYMLTPVFKNGSVSYRIAYKVFSPDEQANVYVDAESGDVIKKISTRHHGQSAQSKVNTLYSGKQTITSYKENNTYSLRDEDRGIVTYWGSDAPDGLISYFADDEFLNTVDDYIENELELSDEDRQDAAYMEYVRRYLVMENYFVPYFDEFLTIPSSTSSSFADLERSKLTTIDIYKINTTSWKDAGERNPDLFVTVETPAGDEVFNNIEDRVTQTPTTSNYVTFNIQVPVYAEGYKLKIWDYDPSGNDLIETLTFGQELGEKQFNDKVIAVLTIIDVATPLMDAHWGMEQTLDYFSEKFERSSFDDYGSTVYQLVDVPNHVINGGQNAFATTYQGEFSYMVYGMGDGYFMKPVVELNVMAHEFSHQVTAFNQNGGLAYENESGALNEAFSDIFGTCVENYVCGSTTWLIGHDILNYATNLRSMKDPFDSSDGLDPQPKAYMGENWAPTADEPGQDNDQGGVHTNSGVLNYWFYLLSEGDGNYTNEFGDTYTVKGIGIDKAELIAYCVNQFFLTPYATYLDAANASLYAAELLYGADSDEYKNVFNAWGVVGIGSGYPEPITIKAKMPADWTNTISAWVWADGSEGQWATLGRDGDWYTYTTSNNPLNIVFVNGDNTWNGDSNQSVDISVTASTCIQLDTNTGKRQYTIIDCEDPTAVEGVSAANAPAARKTLTNGQVLIQHDCTTYTIQGQQVQ